MTERVKVIDRIANREYNFTLMRRNKSDKNKSRLLYLLKKNAFFKKKIILSSGKESSYYIDGRLITLSGEGAYLSAKLILDNIKKDNGIIELPSGGLSKKEYLHIRTGEIGEINTMGWFVVGGKYIKANIVGIYGGDVLGFVIKRKYLK